MKHTREEILKKLEGITSKTPSTWYEEAQYREANKKWLAISQDVALHVLLALRNKKLTQADLAEMLKVTRQQVNKIVKGSENLTLDTIQKLQDALQIEIIGKCKPKYKTSKKIKSYIIFIPDNYPGRNPIQYAYPMINPSPYATICARKKEVMQVNEALAHYTPGMQLFQQY